MTTRLSLSLALVALTLAPMAACSSSSLTSAGNRPVKANTSSNATNNSGTTDTTGTVVGTETTASSVPVNSGRTLAIVSPDLITATAAVSSNPGVARYDVATGTIVGVSPGETTITITKSDGTESEIKVVVTAPSSDSPDGGGGKWPIPPEEPGKANELATSEASDIIKVDFKSGFEERIVVCQTKFQQAYDGGAQAWGCKASCNDDETLFSGGANFAAAKKLGWTAEPLDNKSYSCSVNISACTGGLDLAKTGCNTSCYAACFKRTDKLVEKNLKDVKVWVPAPIATRQVSCQTTKLANYGASQTWGCKATCNSDETAVAGGGKYAQAFTNGMTLIPEANGYSCSVNIDSCSGGLDLNKTGCNSSCIATCAKAAEAPPAPAFKSRTVTCDAVKQTVYQGGTETWGCVAKCDPLNEVVASGGWDFGKAETNGIVGRPTPGFGFACAANISRCSGGLDLATTGCRSGCSATCLQVAKP